MSQQQVCMLYKNSIGSPGGVLALTVNDQDNILEVNVMFADESRNNTAKTPQGQNAQDFTANLLRVSSMLLQNSKNILQINGAESNKVQVSNPHYNTSRKGFKTVRGYTETSQLNCNESDSMRNMSNTQVEDSMTESRNKLIETCKSIDCIVSKVLIDLCAQSQFMIS